MNLIKAFWDWMARGLSDSLAAGSNNEMTLVDKLNALKSAAELAIAHAKDTESKLALSTDNATDLANQVAELKAQVADLQALMPPADTESLVDSITAELTAAVPAPVVDVPPVEAPPVDPTPAAEPTVVSTVTNADGTVTDTFSDGTSKVRNASV